ncbi:MAG: TRAP transporter small permease subunit [Pseudomonadota bacterium]
MPSLDFELPHWAYWSLLAVFPLVAMILARRGKMTGYSLPIGYLILVTGGMLGLHRFYLRNLWGLLFLPLFLGILYANSGEREAREAQSEAANFVRVAQNSIDRNAPRLEGAEEKLEELRAAAAAAEDGTAIQKRRATRALEREEERIEKARTSVAEAESKLADARPQLDAAEADRTFWSNAALYLFYAIMAFMAVDALFLPWMKKGAERKAASDPHTQEHAAEEAQLEAIEQAEQKSDEEHIGTGWQGAVDRLSYYAGEFVSYWAVIAVFVYYYEVIARYVFNSPTNWAHEGMFLMFGMQYLIAGAYASLTEAHVRVDIFYAKWSPLGKAWVDLFTSIFFFIFAGTLLVTGWIFAMDATVVNEISFSEWQIAYWPFKWAMVIGGLLLVLQGVAKLSRDILTIMNGGHPPGTAGDAAMREAA